VVVEEELDSTLAAVAVAVYCKVLQHLQQGQLILLQLGQAALKGV
jgi:hypothetical protein